MHICFDLRGCGLGNNGGCRTILKSQIEIENLGHCCDTVCKIDRFTWFKHKKALPKMPSSVDVVIATGCRTVSNRLPNHLSKRYWWVRGHETWNMRPEQLWKNYQNPNVELLVNSECLRDLLQERNVASTIMYQGVDLGFWKDTQKRREKIRIGCLYHKMSTKRWKDFRLLADCLGDDYEYVALGIKKCSEKFVSESISNPSEEELRDFYSSCHIWFAPTEQEGLHNVPMEAALCGCLMVCNSASLSGMKDYAIPGETAMVYPPNDWRTAAEMIRKADFSLVPRGQEIIRDKIGSRESNMRKLQEIIQ